MQIIIRKGDLTNEKCDLLVVNAFKGQEKFGGATGAVDHALGGLISSIVKEEKFSCKLGETLLVRPSGFFAKRVLLVGLGKEKRFDIEVVREVSAISYKTANKIGMKKVVSILHGAGHGGLNPKECGRAIVEGVRLASYTFETYKKERTKPAVVEFNVVSNDLRDVKAALVGAELGELSFSGTVLARDLINTPAGHMQPAELVKVAQRIVKESKSKIKMKLMDETALKKIGAGGVLGISQGSDHPPVMVHLRYAPRSSKKKIVLVGKAITFDSGGLSLKPAEAMYTMKCDMAGAAAVLGVFSILAKLQPRVTVEGIFAACENLPSGKAIRPGDVVKTLNGKTIEVLHTDAEGRVTLADSLAYAVQQRPDAIIDLATLTGACVVALGEEISGVMSNNRKLITKVLDASKTAGEKMWELPLERAYKKEIKSEVADYKNIAGKYGGALTAGLLLQEFVDDVPWVHIDIAGPAFAERQINAYTGKGGTGAGVRTLIELLRSY
ncbi:MAG: leucyl aminopeptidase [Patescibacteria group bacterium]